VKEQLRRVWKSVRRPGADTDERAAARLASLCRALLSERGEVSGARIATEALTAYQSLADAGRDAFFTILVNDYAPDARGVDFAIAAYQAAPSPERLNALHEAAEPQRQELFRRLNTAPGGTRVLVRLRADLLRTLNDHPERSAVDADLVHLFRSWFNRGFLVLQRVDWRTSALILERLIEYEAVHQIQGWGDLRRRLERDRRCYAFFHPALPDEPLIFVEAALTTAFAGHVQPLIDPHAPVANPADARCAMFYSITNCQEGLRGVSFGNFLIKQVVADLSSEFPRLKTFATLSPVPGFRHWLADQPRLMSLRLASALNNITDASALSSAPPDIREEISRLCAYYLLHARHARAPLDPVARFHLANGARLERLNWLGDTSAAGIRAAMGMTANYLYRIADVEANHEAYARNFEVVASSSLERLAKSVVAHAASIRRTGTQ
jgi:malonyl-CoA decarboxylase